MLRSAKGSQRHCSSNTICALEEAYKAGHKLVGADKIDNVLAKDVDGLEPTLTRQGYNAKVLAELLNANRARSNRSRAGQLAPGQTWRRESRFSYSH